MNRQPSLFSLKLYNLFTYGSLAVLSVYFPLYFSELGLSKLEIGMIMAGGPMISIFSGPFWGYVSDRRQNIRMTLVILLLGSLVVVQGAFQLRAFWPLFALMLVFFFFQSPTNSQGTSLMLNAIEGTTHKFGRLRLYGSLGYAVIALGAGPLLARSGNGMLIFAYSALLSAALFTTMFLPKGHETAAAHPFTGQGYQEIFRHRGFVLFLLLGVFVSIPNAVNSTFVSLYIRELGGSDVMVGWGSFLSAFFEIPVFLLLDRIVRKNSRYLLAGLLLVSLLFSLRWYLMSLATAPIHVLLTQMLHSVSFGVYTYLGTTLTSLWVAPQYRASGQALFTLTWGGFSGIVAGFAGGLLYDTVGAAMLYRLGTGMAFIGAAGFLWLVRREQKGAV
ncbi:MFS transporter [Gorillibacterium sp. CAU 1737]|uniref:MFS transporter n=1 Tax=Gorillibacterium sp. CAU 1737 TaxID=3140362 RepID=UPI0032619954